MADKTKRNPLILTAEQRQSLQTVAGSRMTPVREAERARILLAYADRFPLQSIARAIGLSRPTVRLMFLRRHEPIWHPSQSV